MTRCTIQLSFAVGVSQPLSLYVVTPGKGTVGEAAVEDAIRSLETPGGLTRRGIRTHLGLSKPIYRLSAALAISGLYRGRPVPL